MKVIKKYQKTLMIFFAAVLFLIAASTNGLASTSSFTIIPPGNAQAQTGKTYAEWSVAWWRYVLETPLNNNPFFDTTGANCNFGQTGPVFFLVSTRGGTAIRNECRIRAGKLLFIPFLSFSRFKEINDPQPEIAQRAVIQGFSKSTTDLQATIDGENISISLDPDNTPFRTLSPTGFFTITAPVNNIFGGVPGQIYPTVSDGFYLMVAPLSPGPHTLKFGGSTRYFTSYVTYNLYVEP